MSQFHKKINIILSSTAHWVGWGPTAPIVNFRTKCNPGFQDGGFVRCDRVRVPVVYAGSLGAISGLSKLNRRVALVRSMAVC
jgi:hypothetical protein